MIRFLRIVTKNWEYGRPQRASYFFKYLARFIVWTAVLTLLIGCSNQENSAVVAVETEVVTVTRTAVSEPEATPTLPPETATPLPEPPTITPIPPPHSPTPTATFTPSPTPPVTPTPRRLKGILMVNVIVMPKNVQEHVLEIYQRGQELGRDPNAFSKIGDSTIESINFFARFDGADGQESYNLGEYAYLERVIDYYSGSFGREGYALVRGLNTWSIFDPFWADDETCLSGETVIDCEFRLHNPSVVLIRLGSNDRAPGLFDENLRLIVEHAVEQGVVPVLATRPDQTEELNDEINASIRQVARDYDVPLWDLGRVLETLPNAGVSTDGVHLTPYYSYDYTNEEAFERGNAIQNLSGLLALDTLYQFLRSQ
jgi:hypothetical protein